jgi:hypothetical protein
MCRYAFYKYKTTYGCFKCNVGFKRPNLFDVNPDATEAKDFHCPNCGGEMANLGRDLRLPAKHKDEEWACIKYLVEHKYNIYSCGCQGIGFVPHKMEDAIDLVKSVEINREKYSYEEALKEKKEALEQSRKKRKDSLRTKLLLREVKNEHKNIVEFVTFKIKNKRTAETLLHNYAKSRHLQIPFVFVEKNFDNEIKIDVRQLIATEILGLQDIFKNEK